MSDVLGALNAHTHTYTHTHGLVPSLVNVGVRRVSRMLLYILTYIREHYEIRSMSKPASFVFLVI